MWRSIWTLSIFLPVNGDGVVCMKGPLHLGAFLIPGYVFSWCWMLKHSDVELSYISELWYIFVEFFWSIIKVRPSQSCIVAYCLSWRLVAGNFPDLFTFVLEKWQDTHATILCYWNIADFIGSLKSKACIYQIYIYLCMDFPTKDIAGVEKQILF